MTVPAVRQFINVLFMRMEADEFESHTAAGLPRTADATTEDIISNLSTKDGEYAAAAATEDDLATGATTSTSTEDNGVSGGDARPAKQALVEAKSETVLGAVAEDLVDSARTSGW